MRDDLAYLRHIADAIADIEKYTNDGRQDFFDNKIIQDAVIRNLEIIGEAVKNISPATRLILMIKSIRRLRETRKGSFDISSPSRAISAVSRATPVPFASMVIPVSATAREAHH